MSLRKAGHGAFVFIFLAVALTGCSGVAPPAQALPPIRHVFVLLLENQSYGVTFGQQSAAPYLARTHPTRRRSWTARRLRISRPALPGSMRTASCRDPGAPTRRW